MMSDKYTMHIGPGTVIGATAFGPGASANGSVSIGGPQSTPATTLLRLQLQIRGADREKVVDYLEYVVSNIERGVLTGTKGKATPSATGPSVAWSAMPDNGRSPDTDWTSLNEDARRALITWLESQASSQREEARKLQVQGSGFAASGYVSAAMSIDALVKLAKG